MSKIFVDIYDPWREEMCHLKNQKYLQQGKNKNFAFNQQKCLKFRNTLAIKCLKYFFLAQGNPPMQNN